MTETHRTNLLTACAFAKMFLQAADREIRGGDSVPREEAAEQLRAALRALDTYKPQTASDVRAIRERFDQERATWEQP